MTLSDPTAIDRAGLTSAERPALPSIKLRLEFQFALLSAAGGLILASGHVLAPGQGAEAVAAIAVFSAIFGFLFVDWLRLFELPPVGAYIAMGIAAAYCVLEFWELQQRGEPQMVSVAMLLVLVQAILMLQRKSRRIVEQLAVFCLLELVVAAIFNDAINFGLLLIPVAIVGASALSLLGLVTAMEKIELTLDHPDDSLPKTKIRRWIQIVLGRSAEPRLGQGYLDSSSPESALSLYRSALSWSRYSVLALAPAVFLVAAAFFYVLPRRIDASRSAIGGPALVGFDDEVRMQQLGQVMQNPEIALKIKLTDQRTKQPYRLQSSLYLRGKVLEEYYVDYSSKRPIGKWVSSVPDAAKRTTNLPGEFIPQDPSERNGYDNVSIQMTCQPMSRKALFAVAPYHRSGDPGEAVHTMNRWTLTRKYSEPPFPRIEYRFGSHAFKGGTQTRWISWLANTDPENAYFSFSLRPGNRGSAYGRRGTYWRDLLRINRSSVPTVPRLASQIVDLVPSDQRSTVVIAERMEEFLRTDPQFAYTLNLDSTPIPNVDPVEQFLSVDRRGHCQYFASALALMLRSVGIPARVVVGYRTEEYNPIGDYYIARQLHAHAWVEALVDREQIPSAANLSGQPASRRYWMRLDPTPAASIVEDRNQEGVDGLINLANNLWEDYVVDMDSERQNSDLVKATGLGQVQNSYQSFFGALRQQLEQVRAGRLRGSELDWRRGPPWQMILVLLLGLAVFLAFRTFRLNRRLSGKRRSGSPEKGDARPSLDFYARTLDQLQRLGIKRDPHETPLELMRRVKWRDESLGFLTDSFLSCRYGDFKAADPLALDQAINRLTAAVDERLDDARSRESRLCP